MVDLPHNGELLRDHDGRPIVRVWGWISARDGQLKTSAKCIREYDVPKSAQSVAVYFFSGQRKPGHGYEVFGMEERKPSKGTRSIRRDELSQFSVTC